MVSSRAGTAANAVQKAAGKGEFTLTSGKPLPIVGQRRSVGDDPSRRPKNSQPTFFLAF